MEKAEEWNWGPAQQDALSKIKETLTSDTVLRYYDVGKPITLTVDASMKGLGAALIQSNGVVAYASRALTPTEQKDAQTEKEALAVVFGCTKFHKMLHGKSDVTVETDHKPLEAIWKKPIHAAPMRIQRMLLRLQPYEFRIVHISGKSIGLADCLSRLPVGEADALLEDVLMVCPANSIAGNEHVMMVEATHEDPELKQLRKMIISGWPETKAELAHNVGAYWDFRDELSTYNGIVYKGNRIVIPTLMRKDMLKRIHKSHLGMVTSKQRAKDVIYWPGMNGQIEDTIRRCEICLKYRKQPAEYIRKHDAPNSHIIKAGKQARLYRRNRSMIMTTKENPHVIQKATPPFVPTRETYQQPVNPPTPRIQQRPPSPDPPTPRTQQRTLPPPDPPTPPKTTRSGRVIRKPAWMKDMVVSQVYQYPQNR